MLATNIQQTRVYQEAFAKGQDLWSFINLDDLQDWLVRNMSV